MTPESVTTGFGPGCTADELWDLLDQPDTLTRAFSSVATELGVHICLGAYVRGERRGTVYNAAILIAPNAGVLGMYSGQNAPVRSGMLYERRVGHIWIRRHGRDDTVRPHRNDDLL